MPVLKIDKFEGMSTLIAKEKMPPYLLQELINLEVSRKEGYLRKRKGYYPLISTGLTNLKNMAEFSDESGNRQILMLNGNTLIEAAYSGGSYGAPANITNDERSSGSTITSFKPVADKFVIRSGVGKGATTDRPVWYGYIPARERYNAATTLIAGRYLTDQYPASALSDLIYDGHKSLFGYGGGLFAIIPHASNVTDAGLTEGYYAIFAAPEFDGYQHGYPVYVGGLKVGSSTARGSIMFLINILTSNATAASRLTGIDLFVASSADGFKSAENNPAYWVGRIDLNDDSDEYLDLSGTLDTAGTVQFADYDQWETSVLFSHYGLYLHDLTNDAYYRITGTSSRDTTAKTITYSITPNPPSSGTVNMRFLSRWFQTTFNSQNVYQFIYIYDNHHHLSGPEMYSYLGIPSGDSGISDFRYKYGAMAGKRYFAVGFPDDKAKFGFYSIANSPDVLPAQNVLQLSKDPTGIIDLNDESILIFYRDSADLITVFGNQNSRRENGFLQLGCTNHDSIVKIDDNLVAWMDYTGPAIYQNGQVLPIGEQLSDWWDTLTDAEKESCVGAYNRLNKQIYFSFPDYNAAPYTNGIVFVFDLQAYRYSKISAWYILKTDAKIKAATLATDLHLLTSSGTAIHDWNNDNANESFETSLKLKVFNHTFLSKRVNLEKLHVDFTDNGGGSLTVKVYLDESSTASLTATITGSSKERIIEYVADTFEIEFVSPTSADDFTFKSAVVQYEEMRE